MLDEYVHQILLRTQVFKTIPILFFTLREWFNNKKKYMDLSIFGWVGGSGWGQNPQKKTKKNMPLKSILDYSKSI